MQMVEINNLKIFIHKSE